MYQREIEIFNKDNKECVKTRNKLVIKYSIECEETAKCGVGLLRKIHWVKKHKIDMITNHLVCLDSNQLTLCDKEVEERSCVMSKYMKTW